MSKYKLFFFDWDGTLCSECFWKSLRGDNLKVSKVIDDFFINCSNGLLRRWMLGEENSEDINKIISEKSGVPFKKLWNIFVSDCQTISFDPILRQQILRIREKAKTVLVTGNMDCFRRFIIPALNLGDCFDAIVISSETRVFKDDNSGEQFKKYASLLNTPISSAILIDDSEKCCTVFKQIGGYSIKTSDPENTKKIIESFL